MIIPHRVIFYMCKAVRKGLVNIAQALFNHIPCTYSIKPNVLLMACQYDCDIEIFDWAKQQKGRFVWHLQLLGYSAIFHDRYDIMLWIQKNFPPHKCWNWKSLYFAAEVGNVAILDWLLSYVPELSEKQLKQCTNTRKGGRSGPIRKWFSINYYQSSETNSWHRTKRSCSEEEEIINLSLPPSSPTLSRLAIPQSTALPPPT
jgi:hypothetical protein